MKITCPKCATVYEVASDAMGRDGRDVRCTRCDTRWHVHRDEGLADDWNDVDSDVDTSASDADDVDALADTDFSSDAPRDGDAEELDDWDDDEDDERDHASVQSTATVSTAESAAGSPFDPKKPVDIETLAKRPRIVVRQRRTTGPLRRGIRTLATLRRINPSRVVGVLVFLAALGCSLLAVTFRVPIVARVPDLAGLYELVGLDINLRGLTIEDLRTFREHEEGAIVLVVEGNIRNPTREAVVVPAIRFALRSEDAQEIYAWIVEPRVRRLKAGKTTRFRTRLASPPDLAADIHVRFTERRSQHARLE